MFPTYDKKQIANNILSPSDRLAIKSGPRPIIAKWSLSAIFFSGEGVTIKVTVEKGKSITGKYYKDVVLKKLKKYYQKQRPVTGFKYIRHIYITMPPLIPL